MTRDEWSVKPDTYLPEHAVRGGAEPVIDVPYVGAVASAESRAAMGPKDFLAAGLRRHLAASIAAVFALLSVLMTAGLYLFYSCR